MGSGAESGTPRVGALSSWLRLASRVRAAVYLAVALGVAVYLLQLYASLDDWEVRLAGAPRVSVGGPTQLTVDVYIEVYNPSSAVDARMVYYRVYVEGEYAGDGFIPYLSLPSGWSEHRLSVTVDLARAGCGLARAIAEGGDVEVSVEGVALVDLKVLGVLSWRTVALPFNFTAAGVELPEVPGEGRALARLAVLACESAPELLGVLAGLLASEAAGGVSVDVSVEGLTPPFRVSVAIANEGEEPVEVVAVRISGLEVEGFTPVRLEPGGRVVVEGSSPVRPVLVEVVLGDGGVVRALGG